MKCKQAKARRAKQKRWLARLPILARIPFGDWAHEPLFSNTSALPRPASDAPSLVVRLPIARVLKSESLPQWKAYYRKAGFDVVD